MEHFQPRCQAKFMASAKYLTTRDGSGDAYFGVNDLRKARVLQLKACGIHDLCHICI
jgi:hypothetical protein